MMSFASIKTVSGSAADGWTRDGIVDWVLGLLGRSLKSVGWSIGNGFGWKLPLFVVIGGLLIGVTAIFVAASAVLAQGVFREIVTFAPLSALVITPIGFMAVSWLTLRFAPGAGGSGIPQVVLSLDVRDESFRSQLVSLKIGVAKVLVLPVGLAIGASIGREGPTVQIGASIMYAVSRHFPRGTAGLIAAGAGAGVAAAFNTPLAGIVFAIEELTRALDSRLTSLIAGTVVAAGFASLMLVGDYAYFGQLPGGLTKWQDWAAVPLVGTVGGLAGGLFCAILAGVLRGSWRQLGRLTAARPAVFAAVCGLFVALCGLLSGGASYGTGYDVAFGMLHGSAPADWTFAPLKFLATLISAMSGIPGGIFAPSLAIGAGIGLDLASALPDVPVAAIALMGMVAFLTGVVQAPITAVVIVTEMSGNHALIVPLLLVALLARQVARLVAPKGFYHAQADTILRRHQTANFASGER